MDVIDLDDDSIQENEKNSSAALIRGVAARFRQLGFAVAGFDAYTTSNVLKGSGLSSSAAFEVLIGNMVNTLFADGQVDPVAIAQIGQYAENVYYGKPCGLMDQMASSVGGIIAIDFGDPAMPVVEPVAFDFASSGLALCIIDSGADHGDLTDEYAAIPREMKAVAAYLAKPICAKSAKPTSWLQLPKSGKPRETVPSCVRCISLPMTAAWRTRLKPCARRTLNGLRN